MRVSRGIDVRDGGGRKEEARLPRPSMSLDDVSEEEPIDPIRVGCGRRRGNLGFLHPYGMIGLDVENIDTCTWEGQRMGFRDSCEIMPTEKRITRTFIIKGGSIPLVGKGDPFVRWDGFRWRAFLPTADITRHRSCMHGVERLEQLHHLSRRRPLVEGPGSYGMREGLVQRDTHAFHDWIEFEAFLNFAMQIDSIQTCW